MPYPTDLAGLAGIWVGLFLVVAIYSYQLYKENIFYRIAEHVYIGVAFGITAVVAVQTTQKVAIGPLLQGEIVYIIPIILGLAMYTIFSAKFRWVARYSTAALVGVMIPVQIYGLLIPNLLNQLRATITAPTGNTIMDWFNFAFIGVGTFTALLYFILTKEHTGVMYIPTRVGRYLIMIGLGTTFGNTVLMRMAMLSGRIEFILQVLKILPMT